MYHATRHTVPICTYRDSLLKVLNMVGILVRPQGPFQSDLLCYDSYVLSYTVGDQGLRTVTGTRRRYAPIITNTPLWLATSCTKHIHVHVI